MDAVENFDERPNVDVESGFFAHLACDRFSQRLADFDGAARKAPLPFERLVSTFHEHHAIAVHDHGTHTDDGPLGIPSQSSIPITFTTTRFLRRPSNSA